MLTRKEFKESKDKRFLVSDFDFSFELGIPIMNYIEECTILRYLGYGYYEILLDSGKKLRMYKDSLYSNHEEGIKSYNKKVLKSIKHLRKLIKLDLNKFIISI